MTLSRRGGLAWWSPRGDRFGVYWFARASPLQLAPRHLRDGRRRHTLEGELEWSERARLT